MWNAGVAVRTADGSRRTADVDDEQCLRCGCSRPSCTVVLCAADIAQYVVETALVLFFFYFYVRQKYLQRELYTTRLTRVCLWFSAVFTARCYASAVLAMGLCLCVCLSVTSRSSTKTAKQRITKTTPQRPGTLMPKISAKFDRVHPLRGRRMQVGLVKIGDF